jgi:hypothetical protein
MLEMRRATSFRCRTNALGYSRRERAHDQRRSPAPQTPSPSFDGDSVSALATEPSNEAGEESAQSSQSKQG